MPGSVSNPLIWWRGDAPINPVTGERTKGIKLQTIGKVTFPLFDDLTNVGFSSYNNTPAISRGVVQLFDSHGNLDRLATGCRTVQVLHVCTIQCEASELCDLPLIKNVIDWPPGTIRHIPELVDFDICCTR